MVPCSHRGQGVGEPLDQGQRVVQPGGGGAWGQRQGAGDLFPDPFLVPVQRGVHADGDQLGQAGEQPLLVRVQCRFLPLHGHQRVQHVVTGQAQRLSTPLLIPQDSTKQV